MKKLELSGRTFNRLTVLGMSLKRRHGATMWECRCECGKTVTVYGQALINGHTKSCGCYKIDGRRLSSREYISDPETHRRFLYKTILASNGCLEWNGSKNPQGYGKVRFAGKSSSAHRASYRMFIGPIENGALVLHRCDNPRCCAPHHLFTGTQRDNMQDCIAKGRFTEVKRRYGLNNPCFKLTKEQVETVTSSTRTCIELGSKFKVHPATIARVRKRMATGAQIDKGAERFV